MACSVENILFTAIYFPVACILLMSAFYCLYTFSKKRVSESGDKSSSQNTDNKTNKSVIHCTYIIIITTICAISAELFGGIHWTCHGMNHGLLSIINNIFNLVFAVQLFTLLILFYVTVNAIFIGTSFELSKITKTIYKIMFIAEPIYIIIVLIARSFLSLSFWAILVGFCVLFLLLLMISIIILYIYKLICVYRSVGGNKNEQNTIMVDKITKLTILCSISIGITFCDFVSLVIGYSGLLSTNYLYFHYFVVLFDIYTNLICIVLSSKIFEKYYVILCKCMDIKCKICWTKIANNKVTQDEKYIEKEIEC